jgi:hypothetical protein
MAKQSFSVGQVLTAAQMTSLQQTAMLGGSTTAKTTSYTLVAADAGTVVSVSSTSATTITVNTALFSAGDTVTIQNWGSGAVTITAGTATVNTAGSLIVPQYDGGVLYFRSTSAAIYFDFVQAGAVSPLTTKGDLYTFASSDTRLGVGANGTILTADSAEATGLKWATPASGGGMTLLSTTSLTGSSVDISSISSSYTDLVAVFSDVYMNDQSGQMCLRFNSVSSGLYTFNTRTINSSDTYLNFGHSETSYSISGKTDQTTSRFKLAGQINMPRYTSSTAKFANHFAQCSTNGSATPINIGACNFQTTSAISTLTFFLTSGTFTDGTVYLYGVK